VAVAHAMVTARQRLAAAQGKLDTLSPLAVLNRGYSITTADERILSDAADVTPGSEIVTRLARGRLTSTVTKSSPDAQE
jgi:exodeoxyribonuclease VII large subunit